MFSKYLSVLCYDSLFTFSRFLEGEQCILFIVAEEPPTKQIKQLPSGEQTERFVQISENLLFSRGEIIVQTILFIDLNQNHTIVFIDDKSPPGHVSPSSISVELGLI